MSALEFSIAPVSAAMTRPSAFAYLRQPLRWSVWGLFNALALYLVVALYAQQQVAFALLGLVVTGIASYVFISKNAYAHRYIYPAVAGMLVFVIFPLLYTVGIGFTNYSATNLLSFEQVQRYHLNQTYLAGERFAFSLHPDQDGALRLRVDQGEQGVFVSPPLQGDPLLSEPLELLPESAVSLAEALPLREVIQRRAELEQWVLRGTDGALLRLYGLREVAAVKPLYRLLENGDLLNTRSNERLEADQGSGFYVDSHGNKVAPGFTVYAGWSNFARVLSEESIRDPFLEIFVWTVAFAGLTVLFTLALGLVLASLLQWDLVRGKAFYRVMLILPYAVPAFISILVFRGLFNQNFGEINLLLDSLFGVRPDWFSDPTLARSMILIVNTWLGYPYMLLLSMGLLQAIPRDLYEASAMDGATPLDNLLKITLSLLIKPLAPLLIASFAFNFNNFVLITLLTRGGPDIIGATTPAGTTDLLGFIGLIVFPLLMVVSISFREGNFATGSLLPDQPTLEHWSLALGIPYTLAEGTVLNPPFPVLTWLWNSLKIAIISSLLILMLSTTSAYAFARMRFAGKGPILKGMLIFQMFPPVLSLVAIYALFDQLGKHAGWLGVNSHGAVIVASLGGMALHIWTIKGYFESIDASLEEAAIVDGATTWQAFVHILLPMSVPILAVVFILAFITSITEYPIASVLLMDVDKLTLSVGAQQYLYEQNYLWGDFAAAAVLSGLPITAVFLYCQKWIVGGLTAGGVKG